MKNHPEYDGHSQNEPPESNALAAEGISPPFFFADYDGCFGGELAPNQGG